MNRKSGRRLARGVVSLFASVPVAVSAQSTASGPSGDGGGLEEVIVTAQYREERLIEVPITINLLGTEELARRGITNLQDLSFAVPEMITVVTGMAQNRVMLRGIGEGGGNFPLVGVYLDEVAASGPLRGPLDIRPLDVERIEVLNGPQGTLYGQESVGGTVRFVTGRPVLGADSLSASAETWGTAGGAVSQRVTGVGNVAVGNRAALRVAGTYENLGGWIDAPTAGRKNINDGRLFQVRVKGLVNLTDSLTLTPMVQVHRNDVGSLGNGENADGNLILPAFAPNAVQGANNDHELYSLTADWDLGSVNVLAVGSAFRNVAEGGFYSPFAGTGRLARFDNRDKARSGEVRISSARPGPWQWTVGAFYRHADFNSVTRLFQMGPVNSTTGTTINIVSASPIVSDSWSLYGNTSFDLTERLQIGSGLRYFTDTEQAPRIGQADQTFDSVDPRIYASFKVAKDWSLYAIAAKGFRSGGFNAVNAAFPEAYEPEKVWSYEIGTKFEALDGMLSGQVAGFASRYSNMQSTVIATSIGQSYTGNVGRSDVKGIDWSFAIRPVDAFAFGASGAILDTEVVDVLPRSAYAVGDRLNYIPNTNLSFFVESEANLPGEFEGRVRLDYNRRGASVFAQRTVNLTANGDTLDLLNVRVTLDRRSYGIELYSENLLNERGSIFPNPVAFATRAVPRTVGIRGKVSR
jgi:outer membrane receptor protein involved in Fe transport